MSAGRFARKRGKMRRYETLEGGNSKRKMSKNDDSLLSLIVRPRYTVHGTPGTSAIIKNPHTHGRELEYVYTRINTVDPKNNDLAEPHVEQTLENAVPGWPPLAAALW